MASLCSCCDARQRLACTSIIFVQANAGPGSQLSFWDLLNLIVEQEPPQLDEQKYSKELCHFVACCLQKVRGWRCLSDWGCIQPNPTLSQQLQCTG